MAVDVEYRCAFVVVSFNAARDIGRSVCSALAICGENDIVVVVDNASTDASKEILETLAQQNSRLKLILLERNVGFGSANNIAFEKVAADWYFLLNGDAWFMHDSVSDALLAIAGDQSIVVCGLPLVFPDGRPQTFAYSYTSWRKWLLQLIGMRAVVRALINFSLFRKALNHLSIARNFVESSSRSVLQLEGTDDKLRRQFSGKIFDADWVCGAAMLLRGEFVRVSKGFDRKIFLYGEDEDICITAHTLGYRVVWCEVFPVVHVFGWGENRFNAIVADLKYQSLRYFIEKNIDSRFDRLMMRALLPLHVYGIGRFWRAFR